MGWGEEGGWGGGGGGGVRYRGGGGWGGGGGGGGRGVGDIAILLCPFELLNMTTFIYCLICFVICHFVPVEIKCKDLNIQEIYVSKT